MKSIFHCLVVMALLLPIAANAQGDLDNWRVQRVKAMYDGATEKSLLAKALVNNENISEVQLTAQQREAWNKLMMELEQISLNLTKFAKALEPLIADKVLAADEVPIAQASLRALQQATPSGVKAPEGGCSSGNKFQDAWCNGRRIATELYMWILAGCYDD